MTKSTIRGFFALLLGIMLVLTTGVIQLGHADVISEFEVAWEEGTPDTVGNATTHNLEIKVNENDDLGAAGVVPVKFDIQVEYALFPEIPEFCDGADSEISADGKQLSCYITEVDLGSAHRLLIAITADGFNGADLTASVVKDDDAANAKKPKDLKITADTGYDFVAYPNYWGNPMGNAAVGGVKGKTLEHSVFLLIPEGGQSVASTVKFNVRIINNVGSSGETPSGRADEELQIEDCFTYGYINYSSANFNNGKPGCNIEKSDTEPGLFHVTLTDVPRTGIDYKTGSRPGLPNGYKVLAAVRILMKTDTVILDPAKGWNTYQYHAVIEDPDIKEFYNGTSLGDESDKDNNEWTRNFVLDGNWSTSFNRFFRESTIKGTNSWDTNPRVIPGQKYIMPSVSDYRNAGLTKENAADLGNCMVFPNAELTEIVSLTAGTIEIGSDYEFYYTTDTIDDPHNFACTDEAVNWQELPNKKHTKWIPSNPPTWVVSMEDIDQEQPVTAVRGFYHGNTIEGYTFGALRANMNIRKTATEGDQIWVVGSRYHEGSWQSPAEIKAREHVSIAPPLPDPPLGLPATTSGTQDVIYVVNWKPSIHKDSSATGELGVPMDFTLKLGAESGDLGVPYQVDVVDTLPADVEYVEGSAVPEPTEIMTQDDGSVLLKWDNYEVITGQDKEITYQVIPLTTGSHTNSVTATKTGVTGELSQGDQAKASRTFAVMDSGKTVLTKSAEAKEFVFGLGNSWLIELLNADPREQDVVDIIDILPFNGDGRDTNYHGSYTIGEISVADEYISQYQLYYTDADPKTLNGQPTDPSNGGMGTPSDIWKTEKPDQVTGIRLVAKDLKIGRSVSMRIPFTPVNNQIADVYDNIAYAQAGTTELQMIRAEDTTTVREASKLQIDKQLLPDQSLVLGGQLRYQLTVKNAGEQLARDVIVTDTPAINLVPEKVSYSELSQGTAEGVQWSVGQLEPGQEATAVVTAEIAADADLTVDTVNGVTVANPSHPRDPYTPDSCIANPDVDNDTDQCDFEITKEDSVLKVHKKYQEGKLVAGELVKFEVSATNAGSDTAVDVVVNDLGGQNLTNLKFIKADQGVIKDGDWLVGDLKAGQIVKAIVQGEVIAGYDGSDVVNQVRITNPSNPGNPDEPCIPDDDLDSDTDQCDFVKLKPKPKALPTTGIPGTGCVAPIMAVAGYLPRTKK